jgi:hypothetical protein
MGVKIRAKGLELDAGGDVMALTGRKGLGIESVEPERVGAKVNETIDMG